MFPCAAKHGPGDAACPLHAGAAGEGRAAAVRVDDAELPVVAPVVGAGQPLDDLGRREARGEQLEPVRARSAGSRTPASRPRRRCGCAHGTIEPTARNFDCGRDAPLAGVEVAGGDRVGHVDGQSSDVPPGSRSWTVAPGASARSCAGVPVRSGNVP